MVFSTEKAFDMLPTVVVMYEKLDIDGYRKKLKEENKGKNKKDISATVLGVDLFKYILKRSAEIKEEVFEIVSIAEDMTIEAVKSQDFTKTIKTMREIFTDKDTAELFKSAI